MDDELNEIVRSLSQVQPNLAGTLRFFGQWFGRAYDNVHRVTSITADKHDLVVSFDHSEVLRVTDPSGLALHPREKGNISLEPPVVTITRASRVHWDFAKYELKMNPRRRFHIDYRVDGGRLKIDTNVNWYRLDKSEADPSAPAVELY